MIKIKRALISVSDKTGLDRLAGALKEFGVEILSTGGTAKFLQSLEVPVTQVSDYTGFPQMLDGRVKTLHPKIHGGLLALRDNPEHIKQVQQQGINLIDMVVINLYPFEKTISNHDVNLEEAIENIDIGGPSMIRSAAKNHKSVAVLTDPSQYESVVEEIRLNSGGISEDMLYKLACDAFQRTSFYDASISDYLKKRIQQTETIGFPDILKIELRKKQELRYGENPHQKACFYIEINPARVSVASAKQVHGKELSFNNIYDLDAALSIVQEFDEPAASIIKHTNPCGAAVADTLKQAYTDALDSDRLSAFGCIAGLNKKVDKETAEQIVGSDFVECIIAPGYTDDAIGILEKKKNIRLLQIPVMPKPSTVVSYLDYKRVAGGVLVQDTDILDIKKEDLKVVTKKSPTPLQVKSLIFGWKIVKHVKSNAIVLCQGTKTVGIGAGQMSRVDATHIAVKKAGGRAFNSTLASDAFFPMPDSIETAVKSGVVAIIQPGGSIKDEDIIKCADTAGIAMVFTGIRHFRH